ncbi:hypothetical protein V1L52_06245 [Treponema sp. HNW]|uniref:InlB B-repeat-containing protein n=1 Tax=Treponema sp. HNW TaxID=3116654 RepID=UPI003D152F7E
MRTVKRPIFTASLTFLLFLTGCKEFFADIEKDFSHWTSMVQIVAHRVPSAGTDAEGYSCVASDTDKTVSLHLNNPQGYELQIPAAGASSDIVAFESGVKGADGTYLPRAGIDYEFRQTASERIELTYKKAFLEYSERGVQNISPAITLSGKDGRKFGTYTFKLRANTPPPGISYQATGKVQDTGTGISYYVLCFAVSDMGSMTGGAPLHNDIKTLSVNGLGDIPLTLNASGTDFDISNSGGRLLNASDVWTLVSGDYPSGFVPGTPSSGSWILRFKTDVEVAAGAAQKYSLNLKDRKGLSSGTLQQWTPRNMVATLKLYEDAALSNEITGTTETAPRRINFTGSPVTDSYTLKAKTATAAARITALVEKKRGAGWVEVSRETGGSEKEIHVSSDGTDTAYRITLNASASGFEDAEPQTFYVTFVQNFTVSFRVENANGSLEGVYSGNTQTATVGDPKAFTVPHGQTVNFMAHPDTHYEVDNWTIRGGYCLAGGTEGSTTAQIRSDAHTQVSVRFRLKRYPVTFSVDGGHGSLSARTGTNPATEVSPIRVEHGSNVNFTAVPEQGYELDGWTVDSVSAPSVTSLTHSLSNVTAARNVTVKFKRIERTVAAGSNAWKNLKDTVAEIPEYGTVIIDGEIKATNAAGNSGEIVIDKNLTIKGKKPNRTDTLNANSYHSGITPTDAPATLHRIFKVTGGTLTLENIKLKKGYAGKWDPSNSLASSGAGILLESGSVSLTQVDILNCGAVGTGGNKGKGGGIYIKTGTLTVSNSTLSSNWCSDGGGGVYIAGGTVTLTNTEITDNNSALEHGGGVYVESGSMRIAGTSRITPSTGMNENKKGKNEVYLKNGVKITFNDNLTGTVPIARITPEAYPTGSTEIQVLDGSTVSSEYTKFTVTPQDLGSGKSAEWGITSEGKLKLTSIVIDGSGYNAWKKLKEAVQNAQDGDTITIVGEIKATSSSGNSGEIVIDKNLTIKGKNPNGTDTLNANKADTGKPKHRIFNVKANAHFDLDGLTLVGGQTSSGDPHGGAIFMSGANITSTIKNCIIGKENNSNIASQQGGGIYLNIAGGSLTLEDTQINSCTADGGGGIYLQSGNLIFEGVQMKNNTAVNGKGRAVWVEDGSFKIKDSSTTKTYLDPTTTSSKNPDDVYLADGKTITVNGTLTGIPAGAFTSPQAARITPQNYTAGTQVVEAENGVSIGDVTNKFTVTPQTAPSKNWIIDKKGRLRDFDGIDKDVIAAFDGNMNTTTIKKYNEMIGHFIFYKTSSGNYGVMIITETPLYAADAYKMKFSYKTYDASGSVLKEGEETVSGTFSFDLDTGTTGNTSLPGVDFFLHNSINIVPKNNARFFTQNPPQ